ncbi:MAG: amino acid ABC transporter substrate-binding protein [Rhodospirillaceae bacterium]
MLRRRLLTCAAALAAAALALPAAAQDKIRIGYAISKSGPNATGAGITTLPNYKLWVEDVNAAGGLMLKGTGRKAMLEVVEYDDRSQSEEAVKLIERLVNQDKVDFILPPWGTAMNLAVAPLLARAGYPHLAATAATEKVPEFAKRWNSAFWLLGQSSAYTSGLVEVLKGLRDKNQIGNKVAMVSVADGFGIEMVTAARPIMKAAGFDLVMDKTYPVGTQDLGALITEAARLNPDVFVAFSYPPDTIGLTDQAKTLKFNPKVFYTAVGTAFPIYVKRFDKAADGVMGIGGWNPDLPATKAYFERHKKVLNAEPDRWASAVTYASLEILGQAIERVGKIDRAAAIKEINDGTFQTVIGPVKFEDNQRKVQWLTGQWQDGEFYGVSPANMQGAKPVKFPKPAW